MIPVKAVEALIAALDRGDVWAIIHGDGSMILVGWYRGLVHYCQRLGRDDWTNESYPVGSLEPGQRGRLDAARCRQLAKQAEARAI